MGEEYDSDNPPVRAGLCLILAQRNGYTYSVSFPSGVEYNEETGSETAAGYHDLENQANLILQSFRLLDQ